MRSAIYTAILVVMTVGCAAPTESAPAEPLEGPIVATVVHAAPATVWHVVVASEDLVPWVRDASDNWAAWTPCATSFEVTTGPVNDALPEPHVITVRWGTMPSWVSPDAIGWTDWAKDRSTGGRVLLLPPASASDWADFGRVVRHELGHAMGLEHDDSVPGVMMSAGFVEEVTSADGRAYGARWCN